jgi:glycosyltransferase involved in cell wall biosynthesis
MLGRASPLRDADRLRDAGRWAEAARAYEAWLAKHPADWRIWVQHGHAVKEAGDPAAALASYRRAEAGLPADADVKLQIGHALKLGGDHRAARAAYAAALELDPGSEAAWQELSVLLAREGDAPASAPGGAGLPLVLDLSDLMAWFDGARAPTGIQRIQMEIAAPLLRPGAAAPSVTLAVFRPESGTWRALPHLFFHRLAGLSRTGTDPAEPAWQEAVVRARDALAAAPELGFEEGSWLVNLGSSWTLPDYHRAVRQARAQFGLRYAPLVHDCGPVVAPEHSPPEVTANFARWLASICAEADLILAVSEATARDVIRLRADCLPGLPEAPVRVLRPDAAPRPLPPQPHPGLAALRGQPYVAFVATVESRKDHLFVLNAWLALLRRRGAAVPKLVLAGRTGFGAGPALALLERAPQLANRVLRLEDLPDGALAGLVRGALFTVYNSAHEGWGLPVTEALAAGKVVVAPGHSGLLESGAGLALHFEPGSEPAFLALVERLLDDAGYRRALEARVASGLRLRSWEAVAEELLRLLMEAPDGPPAPRAPAPGTMLRLAVIEGRRPSAAMLWADRLRDGMGWHAPEGWGCWTRPGRAVLRLPVEVAAGEGLRLHLGLRGAGPGRVTLRVEDGEPVAVEMAAEARPVVALELAAGATELEIGIEAGATELDGRTVGVGVVAVMACRPDDLMARLEFLERLRFVWPEVG